MDAADRKTLIGWIGFISALTVLCGSILLNSLYAPRPTALDPLVICAQYQDARGSHFCVELARSQKGAQ